MPPKQKFTKQEIIAAALDITRRDGITAITARGLGDELGSSARPIFTVFKNMQEVEEETIRAARDIYNEYIERGMGGKLAFMGVGIAYVAFAQNEPKLFQLLFMQKTDVIPQLVDVLNMIDENSNDILNSIRNDYGLKPENMQKLYQHLWIYTHGIATLVATQVCDFSQAEIVNMLNDVGGSLIRKMKMEENQW